MASRVSIRAVEQSLPTDQINFPHDVLVDLIGHLLSIQPYCLVHVYNSVIHLFSKHWKGMGNESPNFIRSVSIAPTHLDWRTQAANGMDIRPSC